MSISGKLNCAVIGTGNIGFHHARIYNSLPETNLVAIVDADKNAASKTSEAHQCPAYSSLDELLGSQTDIDLFSVATPTETHTNITHRLLENGHHVLVEKPITRSASEAEELIQLADEKNLFLGIGLIERFNPVVRKTKELIENGKIGEIITVSIRRVGGYPPKIAETGVFWDLGIHDIDLSTFLMDDFPSEVHVHPLKVHNNQVEDACTVMMRFDHATAMIQNNWISPVKIRTISVTGTQGVLEANLINQQIRHYNHNVDADTFFEDDNFGEFLRKYGEPSSETIKVEFEEPLKLELQHVVDVIQNKTPYLISHQHMIQLTELLERHAH
jgi:UDP-N-acetylglucosamine 3-dehydrogenase